MVVCKYFQQGYCRFGQNCRYEHVYGSKYSYHAPQQTLPPAQQPQQAGVTDEQLVNQVQSDVQAVLKGGQWLLSSYAPFKEKPELPGIPDLSPEEARLFIYEAKAGNTVDQAVAYMNNIFKETRLKYEQLLQPSPPIVKVLRSLYNGEAVSSPFTTTQNTAFGNSNAPASSIFRSAVQNTSVFGPKTTNNPSVFAQNNAFGPTSPGNAAKSIFAQATQSVFSPQTNVFAPSPDNTAAKSIFAQANQSVFTSPPQSNPANVFANASQQFFSSPTDPFNQKQSGSLFQNAQPGNVVQKSEQLPANVFGPAATNVFAQQNTDDIGVYSNMEEMTEDDLESYKSDSFRLGFIPELPPPHALCA